MTQSFEVRDVRREDFAGWKLLWDGYNEFYGRSGVTALAEQITQTTWARFFDADEAVHALVAERAGKLLGLAHFLFHRTTIQLNDTCYLNDLFTLSAARGEGVGRALICAVYDKVKLAGATRVYWQTHETNLQAMKLYDAVADKSGFLIYRKSL
jgi:GNAT superfamily N-acetyltransferase